MNPVARDLLGWSAQPIYTRRFPRTIDAMSLPRLGAHAEIWDGVRSKNQSTRNIQLRRAHLGPPCDCIPGASRPNTDVLMAGFVDCHTPRLANRTSIAGVVFHQDPAARYEDAPDTSLMARLDLGISPKETAPPGRRADHPGTSDRNT
jgi:hypothetical protein